MNNGRVVVIPDVHVPLHDKRAWALALKIVQDLKPDVVLSLGDFADFEALSAHGKEFGRKPSFKHEIKAVNSEWRALEQAAGRAKIVLCVGNHSTRLLRYVANNAAVLEAVIPDFQTLFGMRSDAIVVPYQQEYRIGKVVYLHDVGYSGKMATHQTLEAVGSCVVHGHVHRASIVYSGDTDGQRRFGLCPGWLGDVSQISYMAPSKTREWQHGIGVIDYRKGFAFAHIIPIVKGVAYFDGRMYK